MLRLRTCRQRPREGPSGPSRRALIEEARALVTVRCPAVGLGLCLPSAAAIIEVAARQGVRLVLQAGSASWPFCDPATTPEPLPTHFGYVWEGARHPAVQRQFALGRLPEMHVWAGDPAKQEIVDPTTHDWPRLAKVIGGFMWSAPPPPDFLWGRPPVDVLYEPFADATMLAASLVRRMGWPLR